MKTNLSSIHDAADDAGGVVSGDLPCAGGLIAGTLALMTSWAAPPDPACAAQRPLLARKIVSNLFFLRHHPELGEPMRRVIGKVHERWLPLAQLVAGSEFPAHRH